MPLARWNERTLIAHIWNDSLLSPFLTIWMYLVARRWMCLVARRLSEDRFRELVKSNAIRLVSLRASNEAG
jgi:hypothetical protein